MKTKLQTTIALLRRGWTTPLDSATKGGCWSLSQRVGNLRRSGVVVLSKWVTTPSGARVMAYRIDSKSKAA